MLYFIRHAESAFNYDADIKLREQMGQKYCKKSQQYKQLKFDPKYADCSLTENGKNQCLKAHQQMKQISVNLVLVSPMRRALQTCSIIFKDHPNKPRIVVDPNVREIFSSSCDIGSRLIESMEDFKEFDFGLIERPECWYIQSIRNQQLRKQLEGRLNSRILQRKIDQNNKKQVNEASFQIMNEYLLQNFGKISQNTFSNFQAQKQRLKQMTEKYQSVAVVSHHDNIITYTNKPTKNCEILRFPVSEL